MPIPKLDKGLIVVRQRNFPGRVLGPAARLTVAFPALMGLLAFGQSAPPTAPAGLQKKAPVVFDVVSIRPNHTGAPGMITARRWMAMWWRTCFFGSSFRTRSASAPI